MKRLDGLIRALTAAGGLIAIWYFAIWCQVPFGGDPLPHFILPSPDRVMRAMWEERVTLGANTLTTAVEIVLGIILGVGLGMATAMSFAAWPWLRRQGQPVMVVSQAIPIIALGPIFILWFGYGIWPKIAITTLVVYFPVAVAFHNGLRRTDRHLLDMAKVMGAGRRRTLWLIRAPAALPALGAGLKLASVYAPIGAVFGEWVGSAHGLGALMLRAQGRVKIDQMFAAAIVLACLALAMYFLASLLSRRLARWQPESG